MSRSKRLLLRLENINNLGVTPNGVIGVLTSKRGFIKPKKKRNLLERLRDLEEMDESYAPVGASIYYGESTFRKEENHWVSEDSILEGKYRRMCEVLWLANNVDFSKLSIPLKERKIIKDMEIDVLTSSKKTKPKKLEKLITKKFSMLESRDKLLTEAKRSLER